MAGTLLGLFSWGPVSRDDVGHRTYPVSHKVEVASYLEGPATALQTPGLPSVGSTWAFGDDLDVYAYCTPQATAKCVQEGDGERASIWLVEQTFTTKPMSRCNSTTIDSPLSEPAQIRGGFSPFREEAIYDRFGDFLLMSSLERMTGPEVEIERGRPIVTISMNVATLPLATFSEMIDTGAVNDATMWGLPARCIRLAEVSWERYLYGVCTYFYRVNYTFEIKFDTWNRFIVDQGTRVKELDDEPISATNPLIPFFNPLTHKPDIAFLDGDGNPVYVDQGEPFSNVHVWEKEIEYEYNFFTLGIPATL